MDSMNPGRTERLPSMVPRQYWRVVLLLPLLLFVAYLILNTSAWDSIIHRSSPKVPQYTNSPGAPEPTASPKETDVGPDYWLWNSSSRFHHRAPNSTSTNDAADLCAGFPTYLLPTIQVILKIGAGESSDRLDAQVSSVTKCIPNLIVVSDMDHELGPYHAHDILADLPASYRMDNPDFAAYDAQRNLSAEGNLESGEEGWRLDRYKFLPMVERAYEMNSAARWFVFFEADTYVFWDNLFRLLDNYDPSVPLYMGSPAPGRHPKDAPTTWFAYGGTGFVLSTAAAQTLLSREVGSYGEYTQPRLSKQFEDDVKRDCCGDSVLGWALFQKGVELAGLWPLFNPHPLRGVPYSALYWCQPVISMHKTLPEEMVKLWEWEQSRDRERPLLYADLAGYSQLGTFATRADWDNADWDGFQEPDGSPAHASFEACGTACHEHADCFQYTYHLKRCTFVRSFRLGEHKDPEGEGSDEEKRFEAGWDTEKIQDWKTRNQCEHALWVKPSLERIF